MTRTADGGFALFYGDPSGYGLEKYGPDGTLQWKNNYGITYPVGFIQTSDGGFAIVSEGPRGSKNATIIKTDAGGLLQWRGSFGSGLDCTSIPLVAQSKDGGFFLLMDTGNLGYNAVKFKYQVRLDAAGNKQWDRLLILSPELNNTNGLSDGLKRIIRTSDGGFLVIGARSEGSVENLMTVTLSPGGDVTSKQIYSGTSGFAPIVIPVNGGILVSIPTGPGIMTLIKMNENGIIQWSNRIDDLTPLGLSKNLGWGPGPVRYCEWDSTNVVAGDDGYYLLAQERTGDLSPGIAKLNVNGTLEWFKTIGPTYEKVILSAGNGYYKLAGWDSGMLHVDTFRDAMPGEIAFQSLAYNASNGPGNVTIALLRQGGADGEVSVGYATLNGSAIAGLDYISANDTITFGDNETIRFINVSLLNRNLSDGNLSFSLALNNAIGGASIGAPNVTTVIISYVMTPTPSPSIMVPGVALPFFGGNSSSIFHYPSIEKAGSIILALVTGVFLAFAWPWLSKLLQLLYDAIKSYLQRLFSVREAKYRGVVAKQRRQSLFGVSLMELFTVLACILLIGITFAYVKDYLFSPENCSLSL